MTTHLLGGCGSSGTTLLARLLDGAPGLRSGPETAAFCHPALYRGGPLRPAVYGLFAGHAEVRNTVVGRLSVPLTTGAFCMERPLYGLRGPAEELALIDASTDFGGFEGRLRAGWAATLGVEPDFAFLDQTPKNAVVARDFLSQDPARRFIHLVRDPRDVVVSLTRRWAKEAPGHPLNTYVQASMVRWTHDVAEARKAADLPGYLELRYEELVHAPIDTVNRALSHLGLEPVGDEILDPSRSLGLKAAGARFHGGAKPTWGARVDGAISTRGVGQWRGAFNAAVIDQMRRFVFTAGLTGARYEMGPLLDRFAWEPA